MLISFVIIGWVGVALQAYLFIRMKRLHKKVFVATPSASDNSRYVTALDVVREYVKEVDNSESSKFVDWLYHRLNPPKAADCT